MNAFYGKLQALWDLSLVVKEREFVAIVGANGAGKTTLLESILGLRPPTVKSGSITFLEQSITDLPTHKIVESGISLVPEGRRVLSRLTVRENLLMGAQIGSAWSARETTLETVEELFPRLRERNEQAAGTLSGGERQMLVIGRGLMSKPKLLMLDEPSLGLAPTLVTRIFEAIAKIREQGVTVALTEQHVSEVLSLCDRGYVIEGGKIALEGTGKELLNNQTIKERYLGV